ncbi:MAG: peptidylprolyl isomerase [Candidatus Woesearchaeota archaeon]
MDTISKDDFVEVDYTGKLAETGEVFDTTVPEEAKKAGIESKNLSPVIIQVGKNWLLPCVEKQLEGKEVGTTYNMKLSPEEGFGKKSTKFIQLIATRKFRQQDVVPMPGMQVEIDGLIGMIRTVSGGRAIVDFNHPLAGKALEYDVIVRRKVTDAKEKIDALFKILGLKADAKVEADKATIMADLPPEVQKGLQEEITKSIPEVKTVDFLKPEKNEKPAQKPEQK